jgi:hypothetical protein
MQQSESIRYHSRLRVRRSPAGAEQEMEKMLFSVLDRARSSMHTVHRIYPSPERERDVCSMRWWTGCGPSERRAYCLAKSGM